MNSLEKDTWECMEEYNAFGINFKNVSVECAFCNYKQKIEKVERIQLFEKGVFVEMYKSLSCMYNGARFYSKKNEHIIIINGCINCP